MSQWRGDVGAVAWPVAAPRCSVRSGTGAEGQHGLALLRSLPAAPLEEAGPREPREPQEQQEQQERPSPAGPRAAMGSLQ